VGSMIVAEPPFGIVEAVGEWLPHTSSCAQQWPMTFSTRRS
jgi:hypothetical protein